MECCPGISDAHLLVAHVEVERLRSQELEHLDAGLVRPRQGHERVREAVAVRLRRVDVRAALDHEGDFFSEVVETGEDERREGVLVSGAHLQRRVVDLAAVAELVEFLEHLLAAVVGEQVEHRGLVFLVTLATTI